MSGHGRKAGVVATAQETFEQVVLRNPDRRWELYEGHLREKPAMTFAHNRVEILLVAQLLRQLDLGRFDVRINAGHVHRPAESYYIPDIFVVPLTRTVPRTAAGDGLEVYAEPVLLVVEVWSPSTGGYDVDTKLPEYQARGDLEVWHIHPYERNLTDWRR